MKDGCKNHNSLVKLFFEYSIYMKEVLCSALGVPWEQDHAASPPGVLV